MSSQPRRSTRKRKAPHKLTPSAAPDGGKAPSTKPPKQPKTEVQPKGGSRKRQKSSASSSSSSSTTATTTTAAAADASSSSSSAPTTTTAAAEPETLSNCFYRDLPAAKLKSYCQLKDRRRTGYVTVTQLRSILAQCLPSTYTRARILSKIQKHWHPDPDNRVAYKKIIDDKQKKPNYGGSSSFDIPKKNQTPVQKLQAQLLLLVRKGITFDFRALTNKHNEKNEPPKVEKEEEKDKKETEEEKQTTTINDSSADSPLDLDLLQDVVDHHRNEFLALCGGNPLSLLMLPNRGISIPSAFAWELADFLLLKFGLSIEHRDAQGMTALHLACTRNDKEAVSWLLEIKGADVDAIVRYPSRSFDSSSNKDKPKTALGLVIVNSGVDIMKMMLERKASLFEPSKKEQLQKEREEDEAKRQEEMKEKKKMAEEEATPEEMKEEGTEQEANMKGKEKEENGEEVEQTKANEKPEEQLKAMEQEQVHEEKAKEKEEETADKAEQQSGLRVPVIKHLFSTGEEKRTVLLTTLMEHVDGDVHRLDDCYGAFLFREIIHRKAWPELDYLLKHATNFDINWTPPSTSFSTTSPEDKAYSYFYSVTSISYGFRVRSTTGLHPLAIMMMMCSLSGEGISQFSKLLQFFEKQQKLQSASSSSASSSSMSLDKIMYSVDDPVPLIFAAASESNLQAPVMEALLKHGASAKCCFRNRVNVPPHNAKSPTPSVNVPPLR
ncbi:hypothetical protein QOT17_006456 [Balamuthia mandrillaris]